MEHEKTYYVYIVQCADATLYTGVTKNLQARLNTHNLGQGAKYTRGRRPVSLVYCETAPNISEALRRELEIKKMSRSSKLTLASSWQNTGKP